MITPEQMAKSGLESGEQKAVMVWAAQNLKQYPQLKWLHAIPNANSHKQVAEGCRAGISDIFLPFPNNCLDGTGNFKLYSGLYIELKVEKRRNQKNGGCSEDQLEFIDYANKVGYKALVCYSWTEARDAILDYLGE